MISLKLYQMAFWKGERSDDILKKDKKRRKERKKKQKRPNAERL